MWKWGLLIGLLAAPVIAAAFSPYLAWRGPIYIAAGFSGILGMMVMPLQPLLARNALPGLKPVTARRVHRWVGALLLLCVILHVAGLWLTSPPDMLDALFFRAPTLFSLWGVLAMWVIFATALLALLRRKLSLRFRQWQFAHLTLATLAVILTCSHAILIEGTMETLTKYLLCALCLAGLVLSWRGVRP